MSLAIAALAARSFRHEALPAKAFAEDEDEDEDGHPRRPIREVPKDTRRMKDLLRHLDVPGLRAVRPELAAPTSTSRRPARRRVSRADQAASIGWRRRCGPFTTAGWKTIGSPTLGAPHFLARVRRQAQHLARSSTEENLAVDHRGRRPGRRRAAAPLSFFSRRIERPQFLFSLQIDALEGVAHGGCRGRRPPAIKGRDPWYRPDADHAALTEVERRLADTSRRPW